MTKPLVAPKPFNQFTPEEFHAHVKAMYEERKKASSKPKKSSFAEGLTLKRTKKGALSITRAKKKRGFAYVLESEIAALAKGYGFTYTETWNAFKAKNFIIAKGRMEAEKIHADIIGIPW